MALRSKRYRKPSKAELGQEPLKADRNRSFSAKCRCTRLVSMGKSKEDIIDILMEEYDYSESSAIAIYDETNKRLRRRYTEYIDKCAEIQVQRLNNMIEECYEDGDKRATLQAIDLLNKTCGLYIDKKEIKTDGFEIKLAE